MGFFSNLFGKKEAPAATASESFDEKLTNVLKNAGIYDVKYNIPAEELEVSLGQTIFSRGGSYQAPQPISYGIYKDGRPLLYIRLFYDYGVYRRTANREIKRFCDANQVKMLDFFDYMPNETSYIEGRLMPYLPLA